MKTEWDVVVIGAGPAGLTAATEAAGLGLDTLVVDEQPAPGGQIYRSVEAVHTRRTKDAALLGPDYGHGLDLVRRFRDANIPYWPETGVWQVTEDGELGITRAGEAGLLKARRIIAAAGAQERPVPIPGWTLPGVMGAGGAQVLFKSAGMIPRGRTVIAGTGPLVLLVAGQLSDAGAEIAAVLDTVTQADYHMAAGHLFSALKASDYVLKGLAMMVKLRRRGIPVHAGVRAVSVTGSDRAAGVAYTDPKGTTHSLAADTVLLHDGVVPSTQLTRQLDCTHGWHHTQRYWYPVTDAWGTTSCETLAVAGDCAGITGAKAAEASGRLAALDTATRLGRLSAVNRERRAMALLAFQRRHTAVRPLLDQLYQPRLSLPAGTPDDTILCRCEEVTAGAIRAAVADGCLGPNQLKAFTRCGMGPCQGRMCGLSVAELIAAERRVPVMQVGYYRIRPPIKPVTLGALAAMAPTAPAPPDPLDT